MEQEESMEQSKCTSKLQKNLNNQQDTTESPVIYNHSIEVEDNNEKFSTIKVK